MTQFSSEELDEIYSFAIDLGRKDGKLLLDGVERRINGTDRHGYKRIMRQIS